MAYKEELGAEATVILKAIFICKAKKETLETLSLRPAVVSFLSLSGAHTSCLLQAQRGLCSVSQILPPRAAQGPVPSILCKGTRHVYPTLKNERSAY